MRDGVGSAAACGGPYYSYIPKISVCRIPPHRSFSTSCPDLAPFGKGGRPQAGGIYLTNRRARGVDHYLRANKHLIDARGELKINDTGLVAVALLMAESAPTNKELVIRLIMHFLADGG